MLKRLLIVLSILALGLLLYSVFVENIFSPRLSPKDSAKISLNDLNLKVEYNRPSKREREIFGALVPYDKVWRTGANEATTFETNKDLLINGLLLKKGKYTIWSVPMESTWKVMFNSRQYEWGVNEKMEPMWDPNYDVLEVEVPIQKLDSTVEQFTIAFDNKLGTLKLTMAWDNTLIEMPIKVEEANES
ncbi:DUF2911 domain-containing protein [Winogradskyella echinorum]|uniref:DUF2911 domain-containing protein n=1 Tax=Winogradskyella echinorum TaxID=538189 RepID=A0ABR6Y415_9FLAO|nr:DUF2911 domain-containing protein [Winogradskyella echinorum]MBC3846993.1 DUF2911 domain-containing protein [Winogradskyella echinorum]MBC5751341.1 DUF2911 domain-containing protein [Winogradskyella echinorum]